jgi:DNA-binding MarR family transcriptional regulator
VATVVNAVATVGGERMRPSFGFVLRAVAAEEPTVSRLAELLGVTEQATTRLVDDMVTPGFLQRSERRGDRGQKRLHPSPAGKRIRERALAESREMEDELRQRFGDAQVDAQVDALRTLLIDFVERHGGGELAARRSRFSDPS